MIKVKHVISDKNIGGAGRLLLNLLANTDRKLFEPSVVLPYGSLLKPEIKKLGVKAVESGLGIFELFEIMRNERPNIVHTHAAATARIAARLCGAVTVNTRHCADDRKSRTPIYKRAAVKCFDALFTDATIATAEYVKDVLIDEGVPSKKISVIINGSIQMEEFSSERKKEARLGLGLSEGGFVVAIVARLEPGKGHETFIEAARICRDLTPDVTFLIVGCGSYENELKTMAKGLGNLRFLGFTDNVTRIMNVSDANANCSYLSETSSLALSEGMSVGAIPIVSDCGGNSFMADGCGIVFPKRDAAALADALLYLSKNPEAKNLLSLNAKQRFQNLFTAERMAQKTENLYFKLLKSASCIDKAQKIWLN